METTYLRLQDTRYQATLTIGVLVIVVALLLAGLYLIIEVLPSLPAPPSAPAPVSVPTPE